jgi:hypothetical protein
MKTELFIKDLNEFLSLSVNRLNIQSNLANRTGYFYVVNQSTGLVLQAVDFVNNYSLREQVEQHQKRLQSKQQQQQQQMSNQSKTNSPKTTVSSSSSSAMNKGPRFYLMKKTNKPSSYSAASNNWSINQDYGNDEQLWYYYLINGCLANKIIRSGYCMAASSLNAQTPVCFWPNVKTTNCSWFFNTEDQTIVSGLSDDLVLDFVVTDEQSTNPRYCVIIDTKQPNKASQKWTFEFC